MNNIPSYEQFEQRNRYLQQKMVKARIEEVKGNQLRLNTGEIVTLGQLVVIIMNGECCISNPSVIKKLYKKELNKEGKVL